MRVLAIDPGYDRCGIAIVELQNQKETLIYSACIETNRKDELADRITTIGNEVAKVIVTYSPVCLGIETLYFNKNITTGIGVAEVRGVIVFLARQAGLTIYEFGPQEVKVAVTGYGNSDKSAVYTMINRLVHGVPKKAKDDEYDAIAVGITCLAQHGRHH